MNVYQYKQILKKQGKGSKYNNRKFENKYGKWDSVAEFHYFLLLQEKEKNGEIRDLQRQVPIEIQPAFRDPDGKHIPAIRYIADFVYEDQDGKKQIIDVKGMKTDVYKLKKKLLLYKGIVIEEVSLKRRKK